MVLGSMGFYVALAFTLFLIYLVVLIVRQKIKHPFAIVAIVCIFSYWVVTMIVPNISYLSSPKTPEIHGRVTDPTGKPLAAVNVKAAWIIRTGGGFPKPYKVVNTTSNEKGEFTLPETYKALNSLLGFPVTANIFEGIRIIAYTYDYKFYDHEFEYYRSAGEPREISELRTSKSEYVIALQPYTDDKTYLDDLRHITSKLDITNLPQFTLTKKEKEFIVTSHRLFEKKHPYSPLREDVLHHLISIYNMSNDYENTIKVYQELMEKFPSNAEYAKKEIQDLKKRRN